jgi:hypothetical protein
MKVRRGLWRLWIVGSVAWIAFVTFDAIHFLLTCREPGCDVGIPSHLEWALGVPLAVLAASLVIWAAVLWIAGGFQRR